MDCWFMAQKVAAMDVRAATAMAGQIDNITAFCREQAISRQTFYKWKQRFEAEGLAGLAEQSRRPRTNPRHTPAAVEELVLRARKDLEDQGADCGPQSIRWLLLRSQALPAEQVPSRTTIWRILVRHGRITPQPQKRPRSSLRRFVYDRPNHCWQSDWTAWQLADGAKVAIAGTLDDHSRYLVGLSAGPGDATSALVWSVINAGIAECGIPAMSLSDNGFVYTGRFHEFEADFEANLRALGVRTVNSTPYHPQTCGKIERCWQTLKRWLRAQDRPATIEDLDQLLDQFRQYYNHHRPHRGVAGATPAEAFAATVKARPATRPLPTPVFTTRKNVGRNGNVAEGPYLINVGARWAGHTVDIIRDGDHIVILSGPRLVRELTADPDRRFQPSAQRRYDLRGHREPDPAS